jgi:hypothetical protein
MDFTAVGFDWDASNRLKCRSHGVSLPEIEELFRRSASLFPDPSHSTAEQRYRTIGTNALGRHIFLVFTLRERDGVTFIRPISARYMHEKEIRHYEKQKAKAEEASRLEDG